MNYLQTLFCMGETSCPSHSKKEANRRKTTTTQSRAKYLYLGKHSACLHVKSARLQGHLKSVLDRLVLLYLLLILA